MVVESNLKARHVSQMPTITIHYALQPPSGTPHPPSLKPETTLTFDVPIQAQNQDQSEYYSKLRETVSEAKERLGEELTAWRDAVGTREGARETVSRKKRDVDEGDGEDDEGE